MRSWWLSVGILHVGWVLLQNTVSFNCRCLSSTASALRCCIELGEKSHTTVLTGLTSDLWPHISNVLPIIQAILMQMPIKFDFTFSDMIISYSVFSCQIYKIPLSSPHVKAADFTLQWEKSESDATHCIFPALDLPVYVHLYWCLVCSSTVESLF